MRLNKTISLCLTAFLSLSAHAFGSDNLAPAAEAPLTSQVVVRDGIPTFLINGEEQVPEIIYHTLGSPQRMGYVFPYVLEEGVNPSVELVKLGREHGFELYSMPIPLVWPRDGQDPDYSELDAMFEEHIQLHPGSLIIPRVRADIPAWWLEENPDARQGYLSNIDLNTLSKSAQRELNGYASAASPKWVHDYSEALRLQVKHLEKKYGNHIIAYLLGAQSALENFFPRSWDRNNTVVAGADENFRQGFITYAKEKHQTIDAVNRAWGTSFKDFDSIRLPSLQERIDGDLGTFRDPQKQQYIIDFTRYFQTPIANYVIEIARTVKEASDHNKAIIVFYSGPDSGHSPLNAVHRGSLNIQEILESPYIDIIVNPYSYRNRQHGGPGSIGNVLDSIIAHGKMYFVEDDTRSHNFPYNHFSKTANLQESLDIFLRLLPHTLQHNTGRWYMCFGSGANAEEALFERFEENRLVREITQPTPFRPEIAVVLDTESYYYLRGSNEVSLPTTAMNNEVLPHIGAPYSRFLLSDVIAGKIPDETKILFFLNAYVMDDHQREKLQQVLATNNRTAVWFYAPGFIANEKANAQNIGQLTGIQVQPAPKAGKPLFKMAKAFHGVPQGHVFGSESELPTLFTIIPHQTGVDYLAYYSDSDRYGMAIRGMDGWTSVLFTGVSMGPELFRALSSNAGAHIYNHSGDSITGSSNFIGITALSDGDKELVFPAKVNLSDLVTGEPIAQDVTKVTLPMRLGETRIFSKTPSP